MSETSLATSIIALLFSWTFPGKKVTAFVFYDIPGSTFFGYYLIGFHQHSRLLTNHLYYQ